MRMERIGGTGGGPDVVARRLIDNEKDTDMDTNTDTNKHLQTTHRHRHTLINTLTQSQTITRRHHQVNT